MVMSFEIPDFLTNANKNIAEDPSKSFFHFECILANYFNSVYYSNILL